MYRSSSTEKGVIFSVYYLELERIKQAAKKTCVEVVLLEEIGLPFLMQKVLHKKATMLGIVFCMLILMLCSSMVWSIQMEGVEQVSIQEIGMVLEQQGVHAGMLKSSLDTVELSSCIRQKIDQITWVSCKINGTKLYIDIKENDGYIGKEVSIQTDDDLVSSTDGIVHSIVAKKGIPIARKGDAVTIGQILISGQVPIYNEAGEIARLEAVKADGQVWIEHVLNNAIQVQSYEEIFYRDYRKKWKIGKRKREELEGEAICIRKCNEFLDSLEKKGLQIVQKNVTIKRDNFGWKGNLSVTVLEGITRYE